MKTLLVRLLFSSEQLSLIARSLLTEATTIYNFSLTNKLADKWNCDKDREQIYKLVKYFKLKKQ